MDDKRSLTLFFLLTMLVTGFAPASFAEVAYVSTDQTRELEKSFASAKLPAEKDRLAERSWVCSLYGVRSRMQIQRGVELYKFKRNTDPALTSQFNNSGDGPIVYYNSHGDALEGTHAGKGLLDQIRVTASGHLVGKLSLPAQKLTLAYADCTGS